MATREDRIQAELSAHYSWRPADDREAATMRRLAALAVDCEDAERLARASRAMADDRAARTYARRAAELSAQADALGAEL